ncbi:MAG: NHL repeat-containing protein [Vulcanimicrobiaceae bacterium]
MSIFGRRLSAQSAIVLVFALASCGGRHTGPALLPNLVSGEVLSGSAPIVGATVTLYAAGLSGPRMGATALGSAVTGTRGGFSIRFTPPAVPTILYAVALGGNAGGGENAAAGLMGIDGESLAPAPTLTINEFSTVSAEFALAQFTGKDGASVGASPTNFAGIVNATRLALTNLVSVGTGTPASFWPSSAQCNSSSALPNCEGLERINTLADILRSCVASSGFSSSACNALFALTKTTGTTLAAIHAIATDPAQDAAALFTLAAQSTAFEPVLPAAPAAWTLALKYVGNASEFDGPGNMAVDRAGNLWITNNYGYGADDRVPVCGGTQLLELTPTGTDAAGAPWSGGGVSGAGFGIAIDVNGNVWASNFGFSGVGCSTPPASNSVSEFSASGAAQSPASGFTQGPISSPQGLMVDQVGNIWILDYGSNSITEYPNANPNSARDFVNAGLSKPFDGAIDGAGNLWITNSGNSSVTELSSDGTPVGGSPFTAGGIKRPLGIAIDSLANVWISNSAGDSVTMLDASGSPAAGSPFSGGGIRLPWGIAVDGNDNVWIANFSGKQPRLSELCGARVIACPPGVSTGGAISPSTGFTSSLLMRLTGVVIDSSGNVWVANNWKQIPALTNPGGDALVEFVGIAGPVKTPLLGPPVQP